MTPCGAAETQRRQHIALLPLDGEPIDRRGSQAEVGLNIYFIPAERWTGGYDLAFWQPCTS